MSSVVVNKITDHYRLACGICQETYSNPRVLPCLHSFCLGCLDKSIRSQDRTLQCPTCSQSIPVPAKGVETFPINFFIDNMLTVLAVQNPTKCTNCEDSAQATERCLDCVENLCNNCVHAHKRIRQTKDHRILTFEEILANEVRETIKCPSFCGMHPREVLKYFCETCDEAICRDCAIYEHRDHIYVDLKEAVKRYRSTITNMLDNSKRKIPVVRIAVGEVKEVRQNLNERVETVKRTIHDTIQGHIKALEEQEADLISTLEKIYRRKEKVLTNQQEILELDLSNLLSSSDFTENVLRYGNEAEVMLVKPQIVGRLTQLNDHESQTEPEDNDIVYFTSNDAALSKVIYKLGKVTTSAAFPLLSCAEGPGLVRAKVGYAAKFTVLAKDRSGEACTSGNDPISVKIRCPSGSPMIADVEDNNDGTYTASFPPSMKGDHQVNVTLRGKHIQGSPFDLQVTAGIDCEKISSPVLTLNPAGDDSNSADETHEPWGVAVNLKGQLVVTDHHHHTIQIYDANGQLVFKFGIRGKGDGEVWYPAGVAVDKGGNIFVSDHGNNRIQVFTQEGEFLRKFGSKGTGLAQLKGPCGIAVDSDDRVIIADRDNHRINVFDVDGNPMFKFGGYGDADGKFNCPRHISVSPKGEILVSDSGNFRVQVFDSQGKFLYKFGEKGSNDGQFSCPAGISTDSEGHIAIADLKNLNVQIFNSDGEFVKKIGKDPDSSKNGSFFCKPTGIAISENGNIAVADRGSHRVQLF